MHLHLEFFFILYWCLMLLILLSFSYWRSQIIMMCWLIGYLMHQLYCFCYNTHSKQLEQLAWLHNDGEQQQLLFLEGCLKYEAIMWTRICNYSGVLFIIVVSYSFSHFSSFLHVNSRGYGHLLKVLDSHLFLMVEVLVDLMTCGKLRPSIRHYCLSSSLLPSLKRYMEWYETI